MTKPFWEEAFEEIAAQNRKAFDSLDTPTARAAREQKQREEHEKGIRLGWWDKDGNPMEQFEDDDEEDQEDEI